MSVIKRSLSDQIYQILKHDIVLNKYEYGEKLTIKDIQDKYNVSSTPARDALNKLAQDGLVQLNANQGARVSGFSFKESLDILELTMLIDCFAVRNAVLNANIDDLVQRLESAIKQHKIDDINENDSTKQFYENYFHNVFYEFLENEEIIKVKEASRARFAIVVFKTRLERDPDESYKEHLTILEAVKLKDANLAAKHMENHFMNGKQRLIDFYSKYNKLDINE